MEQQFKLGEMVEVSAVGKVVMIMGDTSEIKYQVQIDGLDGRYLGNVILPAQFLVAKEGVSK